MLRPIGVNDVNVFGYINVHTCAVFTDVFSVAYRRVFMVKGTKI